MKMLCRVVVAMLLWIGSSGSASAQMLPPDMVHFPNFAADTSHPHKTASSGAWSTPATWGGAVPTSADVVSIPAGVEVTLTDPAVAYTIVVDGTLTIAAPLTVVTLVVNASGTLAASPGAIIVFPDTPIDLAFDPQQFGHGLIAFGTLRLHGTPTTAFVDLAAEPVAGSTRLVLSEPVVNWKAGDVLVLNDSRLVLDADWNFQAPGGPKRLVDHTERKTIASISGLDVTLTTPLLWSHPAGRDENNTPLFSQVGNLTRDVQIDSENPLGVRGCVRTVLRADVEIENVAFVGLGRTRATTVDNTMLNPDGSVMHMGTNPIGCYAYHSHYLTGPLPSSRPYQSVFVGNVIDGSPKVGVSVHHSHFGLYKDLIITDAVGTDLLLEAGDETGNVFDHNFLVNTIGSEDGVEDAVSMANLGASVWLRNASGIGGVFTNNVVSASRQAAFWFQAVGDPALQCPVAPGIDVQDQSVPCNAYATPLLMTGNRLLSHFGGINVEFPFDVTIADTTMWNLTQDWAIRVGRSGGGKRLTLTNVKIFPGTSGRYFTSIQADVQHFAATNLVSIGASAGALFITQPGKYPTPDEPVTFSIDGGDLRGQSTAMIHNLNWGDVYPTNAAANTPTVITLNNVGLSGNARILVNAPYQDGLNANVPYTFTVTNYQHVDGYNFRFYPIMSAPNEMMPPTTSPTTAWQPPTGRAFYDSIGAPVAGLTNQQAHDQFGLAFLGAMAPCATLEPGTGGAFACGGPLIPIPDPVLLPPPPVVEPPPVIEPPPPVEQWITFTPIFQESSTTGLWRMCNQDKCRQVP